MFTNKSVNFPTSNYRIEKYPTIKELAEMMENAKHLFGVRHTYIWEKKKQFKTYTLTIFCNKDADEMEWTMDLQDVVGTKRLFFHKTNDIAMIYPHILQAVEAKHAMGDEEGRRLIEEQEREEEEKGPKTLGEKFKKVTKTTAPPDEPNPANQPSAARLLSGNLGTRPITRLLEIARQADITGQMTIELPQYPIVIQFAMGKPVHAYTPSKVGVEAIVELFLWKEGQIYFEEGVQPQAPSVQESLDDIMRMGNDMLENLGYLRKLGLNENSPLALVPHEEMEEWEFENKLKEGPDYGVKVQIGFYRYTNGTRSIKEVGEKLGLGFSRTVAIAVNFLRLGIAMPPGAKLLRAPDGSAIGPGEAPLTPPRSIFGGGEEAAQNAPQAFSSQTGELRQLESVPQAPQPISPAIPTPIAQEQRPGNSVIRGLQSVAAASQAQHALANAATAANSNANADVGVPSTLVVIDRTQTEKYLPHMLDARSGALTQEAFQFLLEREFARAFRFGSEFSLIAFCIKPAEQSPEFPFSALAALCRSIEKIKRDVDVFGHLGPRTFAIILPYAQSAQSCQFVDRLMADLPRLAPELAQYRPVLYCGIASVPQDSRELNLLVQSAQLAMLEAVKSGMVRVRFCEMAK